MTRPAASLAASLADGRLGVQCLAVGAAFGHLPGDLVGVGPVDRDVHRAVRQHPLHQLEVRDRGTELLALHRPVTGQPQGTLGGARRAGGDHQAFLGEPGPGDVVALAEPAQHRVFGDRDVGEGELGVLVDEGVHEARHPGHLDARCVLVDEEEGRLPVGARRGEDDHEVGVVADGDEPLLAVEQPAIGGLGRGGRQVLRVGARTGFGHRVAVAALAADDGFEVARALCGGAEAQGVGGAPHGVPQGAGELPQLLLDDGLFQDGEPGAAPLLRHVDGLQATGEDGLADLGVCLLREAVVLLAVDFVRGEGFGELARGALEARLAGGETEVHVSPQKVGGEPWSGRGAGVRPAAG